MNISTATYYDPSAHMSSYSAGGYMLDYTHQIPSPSSSVTSCSSSQFGESPGPSPTDFYPMPQTHFDYSQPYVSHPHRPMPIQMPQLPVPMQAVHQHQHNAYSGRSTAALDMSIPVATPVSLSMPSATTLHSAPPPVSIRVSKPRTNRSKSGRHPVFSIPHPYARLFAKKDEVKRRKIWNHVHEKSIFSPYELSTVGAPQRRVVYIASLEAHIDRLHARLDELGLYPVMPSELDPFKGLNSKTAKSMVAGLQHDASVSKLKLLELERSNSDLSKVLSAYPNRK